MAHKITTMLAATYFLSSSQTLYLTNDLTSSLTSVSVPNGYYTTYLINTSSTDFSNGVVDKPWCILQKTRERLGNYFDFGLTADGKTQIRYRGYSTGSISFVSSSAMKNALGFTETVLTFYSGSVLTSSYQPYGAVFSINSSDSDGWQTEYSQTAYAETPMGIVYGFKDDYFKLTRKFTLKFLPRNQTAKNALGGNPATVAMSEYTTASAQSSNYNHTPPSFEDSYYIQPFTFQHFLRLAPGYPVRTAFGTFQENLSGSNLRYDAVYLRPNFINKKGGYQVPSIRNYDNLVDVPDIEVISCNSGALSSERSVYIGPTIATPTASFVPTDLANLYAWYKYDNLLLSGSTNVSAALDKSGNNRHAVMATAGQQPIYSSSGGQNNLPYWINTDAVSGGRYLEAGIASDWTFLHNGAGFTVFMIMKTHSTQQNYFFGTQTGTGASLGISFVRINNTTSRMAIGNIYQTILSQDYSQTLTTWTKFAVSGSTGDDPDYSIRINGSNTAVANEVAAVSLAASSQKLGIGAGGGGAYSLSSSFHEVIIYNRELTLTEVQQVETYLSGVYLL